MDDLLHNDDLLIRYLDGELTGQEKAGLEERLKTDSALQEQLVRLKLAIQAVKHLGTTQKVAGIHQQMMSELKPERKSRVVPLSKAIRYTMSVAASILVLFIGVRIYMAAQTSPEKLYNEAFVDFNTSGTRSVNSNLSEIEKHYQQKNYNGVTNAVRTIRLDPKDSLLLGLSYLQTERTNQAISIFQNLASSANDFQQDGEFYLSLSYLKNRDYEKALPLMQKIEANPTHLYHQQFTNDFIEKVKDLK